MCKKTYGWCWGEENTIHGPLVDVRGADDDVLVIEDAQFRVDVDLSGVGQGWQAVRQGPWGGRGQANTGTRSG